MWEWLKANPGVAAAIIAVVGGVAAATTKFLLEFLLSERLKRKWETVEVKRKYSSPIVRSSDDLAARIDLLFKEGQNAADWLIEVKPETISNVPFEGYFLVSTIYLLSRLICWIEILKKEQTYLEFTNTNETRRFNAHINLIYAALTSPSFTGGGGDPTPQNHWMYFHMLSCIAEQMMRRTDAGSWECISFHDFCLKYRERHTSEFGKWLDEIEKFFVQLTTGMDDLRWRRIQVLWFCLDRFLEFADPRELRTTRDRSRSRRIDPALKATILRRARGLGLAIR